MPQPRLLHSFRVFGLLLAPVQAILKRILPDHAEDKLRDPEYRATVIVPLVDGILVAQVPQAAVVPRKIRRAIINRVLSTLIDDILIPEAEHMDRLAADEGPDIHAAAAAVGMPTPLPADAGLGVRSITIEAVGADPVKLERQVLGITGDDWTLAPLLHLEGFYQLRPSPSARPTVAEAWEISGALADLPAVDYAEPSIAQLLGAADLAATPDADAPVAAAAGRGFGMQDHNVPETEQNPLWSLKLTEATALWDSHQGKGILIGHIDTGYSHHPEIYPNVDHARGYDTWDNDSNAEDDLDPSLWDRLRTNLFIPAQPGHGTGTGSIIASPQGKQAGHQGAHGVTGTAPQATIIPIRATPTVVILPTGSQDEVVTGILAAVDRGVHVISMSLGSPWGSRALKAAVAKALDAGVIVCAAAGNVVLKETWFTDVMYPAAYPGVIAVAGCDYHKRPWRDTCRGAKVVVTAPGTDVWHAQAEKKGIFFKKTHFSTGRGSGTSFAVATTAGIAACWLRHWTDHYGSRAAFITHLGGHPSAIPAAFLQCLRQHSATPMVIPTTEPQDLPGYDPTKYHASQFGAGIIKADTLLQVQPTAPAAPDIILAAASAETGVLAELAHASGHSARDLRRALSADLELDDEDLDDYLDLHGRELLHHFATSAVMRQRLSTLVDPDQALSAAAAAATAAAAHGQPPAVPALPPLRQQLRAVASDSAAQDL
jgi:hypothetical protein